MASFEQTLAEVRQQVADIPPDEMQSIIDEAIDAVHQEKRNHWKSWRRNEEKRGFLVRDSHRVGRVAVA